MTGDGASSQGSGGSSIDEDKASGVRKGDDVLAEFPEP
ncbi:hypothetical protein SAMN04489715_0613 [Schaalia meyeri]|nr:hypothetical protein SAMN04489715_0613 [Schaalia meyeri]